MRGWMPWEGGTPSASNPDRILPPLPRVLQGKSGAQQQAARCTGSRTSSHHRALQHGKGPAQHPQLWAPHLHPPVWCC